MSALVLPAQFTSVQDGIYVIGKAHMRSTLSLRSFPNVSFEMVPMFVRLMMASLILSRKIVKCLFPRLSPPGD